MGNGIRKTARPQELGPASLTELIHEHVRVAIEQLHEEFRRRVKTQGSLPTEDAALAWLLSLVASGQIKLRRIDGWRKIATVLNQHSAAAA
jgi:transposase-like protein